MNYLRVISLSLLFIGFLISCKDETGKPAVINKENEESNVNQVQDSSVEKSNTESGTKNETSIQKSRSYDNFIVETHLAGTVLSPELLSGLLPKKIPGTERSEPNTGIVYGETGEITTASYSYSFKSGGIVMVLTDYGSVDNIPSYDIKYFRTKPDAPTKEVELIMEDIGKGYIFWDPELRNGSLYYLLGNRLIIKIEAYTLPQGSDLVSYFDRIDKANILKKLK